MKTKKAANQPQQSISPENFIRKKSKNLPVGECFISKDWKKHKLCSVVVTRKHGTGNVTACIYLVDLGCLGVKNTLYRFNVPFEEIEKMLGEDGNLDVSFIAIPYKLAHNVIYAGLEFAEEYGFKPCKDFTATTRFFLEEDTDDIPLMKIACGGEDGLPLYVNTGFESPAVERSILAQLEKTAGKDNYHYTLGVGNPNEFGEENEDDYDYEDEENDYVDEKTYKITEEIGKLSDEEKEKLFIELVSKERRETALNDKNDIIRFFILTDYLAHRIVGSEAINKQLEILETKFENKFVESTKLPNSLFADVQEADKETIIDLFCDVIDRVSDNENLKKVISAFRKKAGDLPVINFLELYYLSKKADEKYYKKLEECYQKYPDYFLIELYWLTRPAEKNNVTTEDLEKLLFEKGVPVTEFEAEIYFFLYGLYLIKDKNIDFSVLLAFEEYIDGLVFISEDTQNQILVLNKAVKLKKLIEHFEQTGAI